MDCKLILFCILLVFSVSCGKKSTSSSLTTSSSSGNTAMTSALSTVNDTTAQAANLIGASAKFYGSDYSAMAASGLSAVWTSASGVQSLSNSGYVTLAKWFEDEFNPDFTNSNDAKVTFAGRVANALSFFCFIAYGGLTTDSTGLPAAGTYALTITTAMGTTCGDASAAGYSVTVTVTDTSDTTYYDKKLSVDMGNNCPFNVYARSNSTAINIATSEDQSCDSRDQGSRTVFHYNKSTSTGRFTYISQAFTDEAGGGRGFEFYRGYVDATNDKAYVLGIYGGDSGGVLDGYVAYSVAGKPSAGGTAAVSVEVDNQNSGSVISDGTYQGCVDVSTNAMGTDNTLTCTVTGQSVEGNATSSGAIKTAHAANSSISDIATLTETTTTGFTDNTDMY